MLTLVLPHEPQTWLRLHAAHGGLLAGAPWTSRCRPAQSEHSPHPLSGVPTAGRLPALFPAYESRGGNLAAEEADHWSRELLPDILYGWWPLRWRLLALCSWRRILLLVLLFPAITVRLLVGLWALAARWWLASAPASACATALVTRPLDLPTSAGGLLLMRVGTTLSLLCGFPSWRLVGIGSVQRSFTQRTRGLFVLAPSCSPETQPSRCRWRLAAMSVVCRRPRARTV